MKNLGHMTLLPPSTARVCPVMKEAAGLARNPTVSATLVGVGLVVLVLVVVEVAVFVKV